jgi:uncharacterized protein (TIGR02452 family)
MVTLPVVRSQLRAIAHETVDIIERGGYQMDGREVDIGDAIASAVAGTRLHLPDDVLPSPAPVDGPLAIEVTNESSTAASLRLGADVACLVFASARNPGGGFRNGAQAQEEAIARGSALYACQLRANDFYAHHRREPSLAYSDRVIYAPGVPVFRDDGGALLARPYLVSFLTAAAPNRSAILREQPELADDVPTALLRRARRVLAVAAGHGHRKLVLGAWGCGVFGNDPTTTADVFATALRDSPWFTHVTFAVLDDRPNAPTYAAFAEVLG